MISLISFLLTLSLHYLAPPVPTLQPPLNLPATGQSPSLALGVFNLPVISRPQFPDRLVIPSIKLDFPIAPVGITSTGAMDVLDNPQKVGWYKYGAKPGEKGSAVIDAHVFQAFGNLKDLKKGNNIYITKEDGSKLRFVVSEIKVYPYTAKEPLEKIFNRSDKPRLNLITCYGKPTKDGSTYTHRLVVFTELAA